jgi:hypothetical protein
MSSLSFAAGQHWDFDGYAEQIPDRGAMGESRAVSADARSNGAKVDISCADINRNACSYHGHLAWQHSLGRVLLPGQKIIFTASGSL